MAAVSPEVSEAQALGHLARYRWAARLGSVDSTLGPLLALSILDAVNGLNGAQLVEIVSDIARALAANGNNAGATELLGKAAGGFIRGGDHAAAADLLELRAVLAARA